MYGAADCGLEGSGEVPRRTFRTLLRTEGVDTWFLQGERLGTMGRERAGRVAAAPTRVPADDRGLPSAASEAKERLRYMDDAGIWASALPNVGGFGSENFLRLDDAELKLRASPRTTTSCWNGAPPTRSAPPGVGDPVLGRRADRRRDRARTSGCARRAVHR